MSRPTLLLYDPVPSPWAPRVRQLCAVQGLRLRVIEAPDLGRKVLSLAEGLRPDGTDPNLDPIPEPMLVACWLNGSQLDRLLTALRRLEVPRTCLKAVLTPDNAQWTFRALYEELTRERASLS